jgi:hypothetical protein
MFLKDDRERAMAAISELHDEHALKYVEALEAVARAAYEAWQNTPLANMPTALTIECMNDLYDALAVVNFLDDDL